MNSLYPMKHRHFKMNVAILWNMYRISTLTLFESQNSKTCLSKFSIFHKLVEMTSQAYQVVHYFENIKKRKFFWPKWYTMPIETKCVGYFMYFKILFYFLSTFNKIYSNGYDIWCILYTDTCINTCIVMSCSSIPLFWDLLFCWVHIMSYQYDCFIASILQITELAAETL